MIGSAPALLDGSATLLGEPTSSIGDSLGLLGDSPTLLGGSTTIPGESMSLLGNPPSLIGGSTIFLGEPKFFGLTGGALDAVFAIVLASASTDFASMSLPLAVGAGELARHPRAAGALRNAPPATPSTGTEKEL